MTRNIYYQAVVVLGELEHLAVVEAHSLRQRLHHKAAVLHRNERECLAEYVKLLYGASTIVQANL